MLPSSPSEASKNPRHITPEGDKRPIVELLPPEVIEYIFETGTRAEGVANGWGGVRNDEHGLNSPRKSIFPVRVSHVCRRWRHIAIDMPTLWTKLDFTEPRRFEKNEVWLERSRKAPLDLVVDLSSPEDEYDPGDMIDYELRMEWDLIRNFELASDLDCILDMIIPHVSRWRSFKLSVSSYEHAYAALKRLENCPTDPGAPILQTFVLYCKGESDNSGKWYFTRRYLERMFPFGGHAPMLTRAVFRGVHIDWNLLIPPSERSALSSVYSTPAFTTNLTDLEFAYHSREVKFSYEEFTTILRCAPNLTSLKLCRSGPAPRQQGPNAQPLFLPNLQYLRLEFVEEEDYACALLRLFYAPALESISLRFGGRMYDAFVHQLAAPMPLPGPQLPKFTGPIFLPSSPSGSPNSLSLSEEKANGRFVDPREPKSILHNITEAKLGMLPCSTGSPQRFYSASPHLKRLSLDMSYLPLEFFSVLMEDPGIPDCQIYDSSASPSLSSSNATMPLCKHLESLTILGIPSSRLIAFVKNRKAQGIPLLELNIDKRDRFFPMTEEEINWLIANVGSVKIVDISQLLRGG